MDIFFRTWNKIVKMKDVLEVSKNFLVVSSLDGTEKCVLAKYDNEEDANTVLNRIDDIMTDFVRLDKKVIFIDIPKEYEKEYVKKNK